MGVQSHLMLYGYLVQQYFPLLITHAGDSILSVVFLAAYYLNLGDQRRYVLKLVACTLLFNIATASYTIIGSSVQPSSEAAQIIGACTILCGFLLYASPFATVVDVVRAKNAASIPIAMVAVGAVSNAVWIVYGCFLHDLIIVVPTIVNAVFCFVQLIVYAVYHPNRRSLKAKIFRPHSRLTARDMPPNAPAISLPTKSELEVSLCICRPRDTRSLELQINLLAKYNILNNIPWYDHLRDTNSINNNEDQHIANIIRLHFEST